MPLCPLGLFNYQVFAEWVDGLSDSDFMRGRGSVRRRTAPVMVSEIAEPRA